MRLPRPAAALPTMAGSVLIVDDHAPFRRFARALLAADGYAVVGEAGGGAPALGLGAPRGPAARPAPGGGPAAAPVDSPLPDMDGFALAERLAALPSPPQVVLVSSRDATAF